MRHDQNTPSLDAWQPKSLIGRQVKSGEIKDINAIFDSGIRIMESEIVDSLLPSLERDLLLIGQAKGKFGGGQRRAFRQTQKKTKEGNKPSFTTCAIVGDKNGHVGLGFGKAKETVPAREKAVRNAKLSMIKVSRGSGSWQRSGPQQNSIPFKVIGKCGSVEMTLIPAPVGTGLVVEKECAKILQLAGIKDCWSKLDGQSKTKVNVVKACFAALQNISKMKVPADVKAKIGMTMSDASINTLEEIQEEAASVSAAKQEAKAANK
ncbi:MAG: small subunit ribosomal protein S5 [Candidatus Woesearchaeota archaeon]|jgi:small subunit ribosomal protein S5